MEAEHLKMVNLAIGELQRAWGLCGGWAPQKHFPAPRLAAPIQAKGTFHLVLTLWWDKSTIYI